MNKNTKNHLIALSVIVVFSGIFFLKLFYPHTQIFFVPDYFDSDTFHVSFSLKYYFSQFIKYNKIPFIADSIGNGLPIFAESQIGALNIINIILYKFFNPFIAFNLSYLVSHILIGIGTYILVYYLTKNIPASLVAATGFQFSGIVMMKIVHQGIFQGISLVPFIFFFIFKGHETKQIRYAVIAGFIAAQQFLFGHLFVSIAQQFLIGLYVVFYYFFTLRKKNKKYFLIFFILVYGIVALITALPQIIQTYLYFIQSSRLPALNQRFFDYFYFLTFFTPFPLGSIKNADFFKTVGQYSTSPWEANLFTGYGTLLLLATIIWFWIFKKKKINYNRKILYIFVLLIGSSIIMLGKVPIASMFSQLPILSSLRAMARFSIFTTFFAILTVSILSARTLSKYIILTAVVLNIAGGMYFFYSYFPTKTPKYVLSPPLSSSYIPKKANLYSIGFSDQYYFEFLKNGYSNDKQLKYLLNSMYPYSNFVYNIKRCDVFRFSLFNPLAFQAITNAVVSNFRDSEEKIITKKIQTYLGFLGCDYLIANKPLKGLPLYIKDTSIPVYIYKIAKSIPNYSFYTSAQIVVDDKDIFSLLGSGQYKISELYINSINYDKAILSGIDIYTEGKKKYNNSHTIQQKQINNEYKKFVIRTRKSGFFFLRQFKFPGWRAKIDGKPSPLLRANLAYMAVYVSGGKHTIEFIYHPVLWDLSIGLMALGYILTFACLISYIHHPKKYI